MSVTPTQVSPEDTRIGFRTAKLVAVAYAVALIVLIWNNHGHLLRVLWYGFGPGTLESAGIALAIGLGLVGVYVGMQELSRIPVTLRLYGFVCVVGLLICSTNFFVIGRRSHMPGGYHVPFGLNIAEAILYVCICTGGFLAGVIVSGARASRGSGPVP